MNAARPVSTNQIARFLISRSSGRPFGPIRAHPGRSAEEFNGRIRQPCGSSRQTTK
jgi:hypothetical protein